jgi:hypothetical protein
MSKRQPKCKKCGLAPPLKTFQKTNPYKCKECILEDKLAVKADRVPKYCPLSPEYSIYLESPLECLGDCTVKRQIKDFIVSSKTGLYYDKCQNCRSRKSKSESKKPGSPQSSQSEGSEDVEEKVSFTQYLPPIPQALQFPPLTPLFSFKGFVSNPESSTGYYEINLSETLVMENGFPKTADKNQANGIKEYIEYLTPKVTDLSKYSFELYMSAVREIYKSKFPA